MRRICMTFRIMLLGAAAAASAAQSFEYSVVRNKFLWDQAGKLRIGQSGVHYVSANSKTLLQFDFADIRAVDISNPKVIRLQTYDLVKRRLMSPRAYTFRLKQGTHDQDLARFLAGKLERPVVGSYELSTRLIAEIPAYHRHRLGGCHGILRITREAIRFDSKKPKDSRTWLYRDIETIGRMDPFHLRVTTFLETYNFDLKKRLPEDDYRVAWESLYEAEPSQFRIESGQRREMR